MKKSSLSPGKDRERETVVWLYVAFIVGIALSRLYEVRRSRHHLNLAQSQATAYALPEQTYPLMVVFHTSWLIACVAEVYFLDRPFLPGWGTAMLMVWGLAFAARIWVLRAMKESWNVRVIHHPQQKIVNSGPYRYIRHPNYLIVIVEIFCIPMIHTAYLTACIGSCINGVLIWARLQKEEAYLASLPGYQEKLGHLPRFIPREVTEFIKNIVNTKI